jgi:hypothetical protein
MAPALLRARVHAPDVDGDPGPIRTGDAPLRMGGGATRLYLAMASERNVPKLYHSTRNLRNSRGARTTEREMFHSHPTHTLEVCRAGQSHIGLRLSWPLRLHP